MATTKDHRAPDQDKAIEKAFIKGKLPEEDRRHEESDAEQVHTPPVAETPEAVRLPDDVDAATNTTPPATPSGGVPIVDTPPRWYPWKIGEQETSIEYRDVNGVREFRAKPEGIAAAHARVPTADGHLEYFSEAGEKIEPT